MRRLLALLLLSVSLTHAAAPEEFPEAELRQNLSRYLIARLMTVLKMQPQPDKNGFDPAKALAQCDAVDTAMKPDLLAKRKLFYDAKARRESNRADWDRELRALMTQEKMNDARPLRDMLAGEKKSWPCLLAGVSVCNDKDSLALLEIVYTDPALIDETIMSTCIRTIKLLKRAGTCSYTQSVADAACNNP